MIKFLSLILVFLISIISKAQGAEHKIIISSGSVTGVYYPTAGAICREFNLNKSYDLSCSVRVGNGSFQALDELRNNKSNLAIIQSDVGCDAYKATYSFAKSQPFNNLRSILGLYDDVFTVVVRADSKIYSLDNVKHARVSYGTTGSGTLAMLDAVMRTKKWKMSDFADVVAIMPSEQAEALCNGSVDVIFFSAAHPNGTIKEIMNTCDVRFISLTVQEVEKVNQSNAIYSGSKLSADVYDSADDVQSFSAKAVLYATTSLSEEMAYKLTKTIFNNLSDLRNLHPVLKGLNKQRMLTIFGDVPLHPGARKYYVETGLIK